MLQRTQYGAPDDETTMSEINKDWFTNRLRAIKLSQRQLAKKIGLDPAAMSYTFSGKRRMTMPEAKAIADVLMVQVTEVMRQAGIEVLDDVKKVPIAGYIGTGSAVTLLPKGTHDTVIAPGDVPHGTFALQLRIPNNPYDGWLVFVSGQQQPPNELLDRYAIVATSDGQMLSAMIRRGYKQKLHNLMLLPEGTVLENREIAWGARALWIQP
jgi:DNA-binding XRE family transcriptional regulator